MKKLLLILIILSASLVEVIAQIQEIQGVIRLNQVECYIEEDILPAAIECSVAYNIPLEVIIAVAILESGYGTSTLSKTKNNHLGIRGKGGVGWSRFRSVNSCFMYFGNLLDTRGRYQPLKKCKTSEEYCWWLQWSGYCSSENYATRLIKIMNNWDLERYNKYKSA